MERKSEIAKLKLAFSKKKPPVSFKKTDGKKTDVSLRALSGAAVEKEIARMLGALSEQDATALAHARNMLAEAAK